jgi:hypothetical protein
VQQVKSKISLRLSIPMEAALGFASPEVITLW